MIRKTENSLMQNNLWSSDHHDSDGIRNGKILNLFSLVRFQNGPCTASSNSTLTGICLTAAECTSASGTSDGSCAGGFGVCCIVAVTACGSTVDRNCSYIRNPNYPSAYTSASGTCKYNINKCSSNICQYRLDFDDYRTPVGANGECGTAGDGMAVTSPALTEPPTICGVNTGLHMYVDAGADGTTATSCLTFNTGTSTDDRFWSIKVTMVECGSDNLAPTGCTQYYTAISGTIKSYNYDGSQVLQSQNYGTCIRQCTGYCSMTIQESAAVPTASDAFHLMDPATDTAVDAACTPAAANAAIAWVSIPGANPTGTGPTTVGMICGGTFSDTTGSTTAQVLTTSTAPFTLDTFTNAEAQTGDGYALDYRQVPC